MLHGQVPEDAVMHIPGNEENPICNVGSTVIVNHTFYLLISTFNYFTQSVIKISFMRIGHTY